MPKNARTGKLSNRKEGKAVETKQVNKESHSPGETEEAGYRTKEARERTGRPGVGGGGAKQCSGQGWRTAASFHPTVPWPSPYLTLVRSLRSVHLLDMSIQVIWPGKEINRL